MALEPITRQEQIVAGKELKPITRMERFLKNYGVSNYFGTETKMVEGDTLTWDGDLNGKATLEHPELLGCFVKISDAIPVLSDCKNGMTIQTADGAETTHSAGEIDGIYNAIGVVGVVGSQFGVYVIPSDGYVIMDTFTFPESGVWVTYKEDVPNVTSITIPGYGKFVSEQTVVKRLDEKYMPVLTSPNGTKFRLAVNDDGTVTTAEVTE